MLKINTDNKWQVQPEAEELIQRVIKSALVKCLPASIFMQKLLSICAIRFRDIIDHIVLTDEQLSQYNITSLGFTAIIPENGIYRNDSGLFPIIKKGTKFAIYFKVESLTDFIHANHFDCKQEGHQYAQFRKSCIWSEVGVDFFAVQRNGTSQFEITEISQDIMNAARVHLQYFRTRKREFSNIEKGFTYTESLIQRAVADLGKDWACDLFLKAEREYWMSRNKAGRMQKEIQDQMGIGWVNQDHHTYDSSRTWFHRNIRILEMIGFVCRERFYAGADAGWGSQILEQPVLGSIIFTDIDLAPHELEGDFAHMQLEELPYLRRAGLWTALHGESILEAGLNHLECMYDHKQCKHLLHAKGISMMLPFSDYPHLYQQLTVGERWPVNPDKIDYLLSKELISQIQADDFRFHGAIGSHFENLERNYGYKGFNQPGIDSVLRIIDPRKNLLETK